MMHVLTSTSTTTERETLTLLCLPHAGGAASTYSRWKRLIPEVKVVPVELPGHGHRVREGARDSLASLLDAITGEVLPTLGGRFAIFGHSMGAVVAFELARRLRSQYGLEAAKLIVSGSAPPHRPRGHRSRHRLSDLRLWDEVHELNGTPGPVHRSSALRRLYLPAIRADFKLIETYEYQRDRPLRTPIAAFGGTDDPEVAPTELPGWMAHTSGEFSLSLFRGNHFYHLERPQNFLGALEKELADVQ